MAWQCSGQAGRQDRPSGCQKRTPQIQFSGWAGGLAQPAKGGFTTTAGPGMAFPGRMQPPRGCWDM
ncbi:hypothetical protein, partial [Escherichia coli]|uniref:hypothetical protein n=1 Tax=Escherichia coli TaxID=562 RepID=UPI001BDD62C3